VSEKKFIDIEKLIESKNPRLLRLLPSFIVSYLKRILHEKEINDFLAIHHEKKNQEFCDAVMKYFNIDVQIHGIENIPKSGPVILAMNHPLGGMDGIAFISAIGAYRKDIKFIVNDILMNLENLADLFVGVNKHGKNKISVRKQINNAFSSDHALCIFPAGLVSRKIKGEITDLEWKKTFVTYARSLQRTVVPIYIDGRLSNFFYRLHKLRKFLGIKVNIEMLYLSNEMFKQKNKTIHFHVGSPLKGSEFKVDMNEIAAAQEYKKQVYSIKSKL
jgi:1-acyl-sn-glycerol-3-phosphate acyltransferase